MSNYYPGFRLLGLIIGGDFRYPIWDSKRVLRLQIERRNLLITMLWVPEIRLKSQTGDRLSWRRFVCQQQHIKPGHCRFHLHPSQSVNHPFSIRYIVSSTDNVVKQTTNTHAVVFCFMTHIVVRKLENILLPLIGLCFGLDYRGAMFLQNVANPSRRLQDLESSREDGVTSSRIKPQMLHTETKLPLQ
jgi:hypothetical protein